MSDPRCTTDSRADARRGTSDGDANAAKAQVVVIPPADRSGEGIRHRTLDQETASPDILIAEECDAEKLDVENLDAKRDAKNRDQRNCDEANPVAHVPERDPPTPENMDLGRGTANILAVTMHSASTRATNRRGRAPGVLQEPAAQNPSSLAKTPPKAAKGAESHGPGHFTGRGALDEDASCVGSGCAVKVLGGVWVATRNTSRDGAQSKRLGLCVRQRRRLAQVNALEGGQAGDDGDRTRGDVAATNTAGVNSLMWYCLERGGMRSARGLELRLDAVSRGATLVSTYAVRLETGGTPRPYSAKDVSKLNPVRATINGTTPLNEPSDFRDEVPLKVNRDVCAVKCDEMPLEVSRDASAVKSDGVA
ncbi:hypothetical protein PHYSODRAFT_255386 [Phytophthora sojae]|uniref:Uncharacterized protein n=1 Tax=Phytophthora sojae (strain P6497) TaxID=1094619 RepID=G4ZEK1_PHYSP|nr:hypothetical protein PHYSODRAFT_255386 [Phytophthora sojae]EGZ19056.1 hypothetical protein PHYSODRAFT_255386 [Phytophthora sojae]|eukprot:XP_009528114.1 hypothetical protein PHYSODRAFT_255386 [Phytophthora sojae]